MSDQNQELVRDEPERLVDILKPLVPLAVTALENTNKELELKSKQIEKQSEYASKALEFKIHRFNRSFLLLLAITIGILSISSGIIFGLNDVNSGLLVLSHVGAIIAGALGGAGWEKSKEKPSQ